MDFLDNFSFQDLKTGASNVLDLFKDYSSINSQINQQQFQNDMQLAQFGLAKSQIGNQTTLANLQAQAVLANAQRQAQNPWYSPTNMDVSLSNMNGILNRSSSTNNLMTYLTIAGIALAVMQYLKK